MGASALNISSKHRLVGCSFISRLWSPVLPCQQSLVSILRADPSSILLLSSYARRSRYDQIFMPFSQRFTMLPLKQFLLAEEETSFRRNCLILPYLLA